MSTFSVPIGKVKVSFPSFSSNKEAPREWTRTTVTATTATTTSNRTSFFKVHPTLMSHANMVRNYVSKSVQKTANRFRSSNQERENIDKENHALSPSDPCDFFPEKNDQLTDHSPSTRSIPWNLASKKEVELIVIAVLCVTSDHKSGSSPLKLIQNGMFCTIHFNGLTKKTRTNRVNPKTKKCLFNERFVFQYVNQEKINQKDGEVKVQVMISSITSKLSNSKVGDAIISLNKELKCGGPVHSSTHVRYDFGTIIQYALHRIVVNSENAAKALDILSRLNHSINDNEDLQKYGGIFPELWYAIEDVHE